MYLRALYRHAQRRGLVVLATFAVAWTTLGVANAGIALQPLDPVHVDNSSRSQAGVTRARITFINNSSYAVELYWIDYDGNRVFYVTLPSQYNVTSETYLTHPWLVVRSGTGATTTQGTGHPVAAFAPLTSVGTTTDFDTATIADMTPPAPAAPPNTLGTPVTALEFYHAAFDHYFISTNTTEIAAIDQGRFAGWTRTGVSFAMNQLGTGGSPVCRFFSATFAPKSSHFYTPVPSECAAVKGNPDWQFEGEVFSTVVPNASGTCPANTHPIYRLYNNGRSGAPNHRYVNTSAARDEMIGKGWVLEGVVMCTATELPLEFRLPRVFG